MTKLKMAKVVKSHTVSMANVKKKLSSVLSARKIESSVSHELGMTSSSFLSILSSLSGLDLKLEEEPEKRVSKKQKHTKKEKSVIIVPKKIQMKIENEIDHLMEYYSKIKEERDAKVQEHKLITLKRDPHYEESMILAPPSLRRIKGKKGNKIIDPSRMTARQRAMADAAAKYQAQMEMMRLQQEKMLNAEKEYNESIEHAVRGPSLEKSREFLKEAIAQYNSCFRSFREQQDWEIYLSCRPLPNAGYLKDMITYLNRWKSIMEAVTPEECSQYVKNALQLLDELETIIENVQEHELHKLNQWQWIKDLFRKQTTNQIDSLAFGLARNMDKNMDRISLHVAEFRHADKSFGLCLWCYVQLPTHLPNPRRISKPRIHVNFSEMKISAIFPPHMCFEKQMIKATYLSFDHISEQCSTYKCQFDPYIYQGDLKTTTSMIYREILKLRYENSLIKEHERKVTEEFPDKRVIPLVLPQFEPNERIPLVPYEPFEPSGSLTNLAREEVAYFENRINCKLDLPRDEINLRSHIILGGLFSIHIVDQPIQPQVLYTRHMRLAPLLLPKKLVYDYPKIPYDPPRDPAPDEEVTMQQILDLLQARDIALDRIIYIKIKVPNHVIFNSPPIPCRWDDDKKIWSKEDIIKFYYDADYDEVTFYTTKFGYYGLACPKYDHFPFKKWQSYPESDGSITFLLQTSLMVFKFNIKGTTVSLVSVRTERKKIFAEICGRYFILSELKRYVLGA